MGRTAGSEEGSGKPRREAASPGRAVRGCAACADEGALMEQLVVPQQLRSRGGVNCRFTALTSL